jgi:hypothetical protein
MLNLPCAEHSEKSDFTIVIFYSSQAPYGVLDTVRLNDVANFDRFVIRFSFSEG